MPSTPKSKPTTAPPNALALSLSLLLAHISTHPLATRTSQDTYLTHLTMHHRLPYYSSTYGHTFHDGKSLRQALVQVMRYHAVRGLEIRAGKTAVGELFERGVEVLDKEYVGRLRRGIEEGCDDDVSGEGEDEIDDEGVEGRRRTTTKGIMRRKKRKKKKGTESTRLAFPSGHEEQNDESWGFDHTRRRIISRDSTI